MKRFRFVSEWRAAVRVRGLGTSTAGHMVGPPPTSILVELPTSRAPVARRTGAGRACCSALTARPVRSSVLRGNRTRQKTFVSATYSQMPNVQLVHEPGECFFNFKPILSCTNVIVRFRSRSIRAIFKLTFEYY